MPAQRKWVTMCLTTLLVSGLPPAAHAATNLVINGRNVTVLPNSTGQLGTSLVTSPDAFIDTTNPFFRRLGSNDRTCATCHVASAGWTITPSQLQQLFDNTLGLDPIFLPVDGTNHPNPNLSTLPARQAASSLLLNKGLIRRDIPILAGATFTVVSVNDPYGNPNVGMLTVFRRPMPTANLRSLVNVMWDAGQSPGGIDTDTTRRNALRNQAIDAVLTHMQGTAPDTATLDQIVEFEMGLVAAQIIDNGAGRLDVAGATGGPIALATTLDNFFIGNNNPFLGSFNRIVFTLYNGWSTMTGARASIARGQQLFNQRIFTIRNVGGLNAGPTPSGQHLSTSLVRVAITHSTLEVTQYPKCKIRVSLIPPHKMQICRCSSCKERAQMPTA